MIEDKDDEFNSYFLIEEPTYMDKLALQIYEEECNEKYYVNIGEADMDDHPPTIYLYVSAKEKELKLKYKNLPVTVVKTNDK